MAETVQAIVDEMERPVPRVSALRHWLANIRISHLAPNAPSAMGQLMAFGNIQGPHPMLPAKIPHAHFHLNFRSFSDPYPGTGYLEATVIAGTSAQVARYSVMCQGDESPAQVRALALVGVERAVALTAHDFGLINVNDCPPSARATVLRAWRLCCAGHDGAPDEALIAAQCAVLAAGIKPGNTIRHLNEIALTAAMAVKGTPAPVGALGENMVRHFSELATINPTGGRAGLLRMPTSIETEPPRVREAVDYWTQDPTGDFLQCPLVRIAAKLQPGRRLRVAVAGSISIVQIDSDFSFHLVGRTDEPKLSTATPRPASRQSGKGP